MPPTGLLLGGVDFANLFALLKAGSPAGPYASLADAQAAGAVSVNYGMFINNGLSFVIVAMVMFLLIRGMNRIKKKEKAPPFGVIRASDPLRSVYRLQTVKELPTLCKTYSTT